MNIATMLQWMGVGGIKLGQFASTRYDLLPAHWIEQLAQLRDQNKVVALSFDDSAFLYVDPVPIATASIGQVYKARLHTGEEVAIKRKKPGAERQIRQLSTVLKVLLYLPACLHRRSRDFYRMVQSFERTLKDETNYLVEAANMERIRSFSSIRIPAVYWQHTTRDQLVTEYIEGESLSAKHPDKAKELVHGLMEQLLIHGVFHADLHPGNIRVQPDGELVLLDFGMVGRLSGRLRESLLQLAYGFLIDNEQLVMVSMLQLCNYSRVQEDALLQEIRRFMDLYITTPLERVDVQRALFELLDTLRNHGIFIKPEMVYVVKALVTTEGVAVGLDGGISIYTMMEPLRAELTKSYMEQVTNRKLIQLVQAIRGMELADWLNVCKK